MTFFQFLIGLSALLLLSTCEKDEEITTNLPQGFPAGCLLEKRSSFELEHDLENKFDENGLLLEKPVYAYIDSSIVVLAWIETYQRDIQGRVVRRNRLSSPGELESYYEYEYEGSNEIPSRRESYGVKDDGSEFSLGHAVYESEGNKVLSIRSFSAIGELFETKTYEYNDEASQYIIRRYDGDEALGYKEVNTYNPERINPFYSIQDFPAYADTYALEKKERFDESGSVYVSSSYSVTYDIDENGRIINRQIIYLDGNTYNVSLIYECE